jgi:RNA polymerase sigma-70 factor (ECF subfamily)
VVTLAREARVDEFIRLFTSHEPRLRAYVLTLVSRWSDAEEVMQQCNLVLWQKFDQFRPGTNFFAWACQIARLEVLDHRKRRGRERVLFGDEFVDAVARESAAMAGELSDRQAALQHCLEKVPPHHRDLLHRRYGEGGSVEAVAAAVGRSVEAVYKALARIRQALHDCITRRLALGE